MNSFNYLTFSLFTIWLCFLSQCSSKAFLKPLDLNKSSTTNTSLLIEHVVLKTNDINGNYYSLNELGLFSDSLTHNRNLNYMPKSISFTEISSQFNEAKTATHHFITNIYLEIKSYLKTPYGIFIFGMLLLVSVIIVVKSFSILFQKNKIFYLLK